MKMSGVITLEQIKAKAQGTIINIPDWEDERQTIQVRVRKIDLTARIMGGGMLPNDLRLAAEKVFSGISAEELEKDLQEQISKDVNVSAFVGMLDEMVREALVEPTYDEIQKIYPLTMAQKMVIFNWLVGEVKQLKPFRGKSGLNGGNGRNR